MFVTGIVKARLDEYRKELVVPKSAVLWTGERSIVYVKQPDTDQPIFKMREINLGPMLGNSYVITGGLQEGEEIVTQGAFSVDAAAQLEGKPSMMNPSGGIVSTGHNHGSADPSMRKVADASKKLNVSMDFTMQLNKVFEQYILLKDAFVMSDPAKVKQQALKTQQSLDNVNMKLLTGDSHMQWMEIVAPMKTHILQMSSVNDLEVQRGAFSLLSNELYKAVKIFGLMGKTVYYQFCPMAFNEKGAYWLSTSDEIRNPYFGESMLTCGENKETLTF
jgi:Cu(I)/Ag(I) efflux system membrane fusion protein